MASSTATGTSKPTTTSTVAPTGDAKLVAAARRAVSDYYLASNVAAETLSTTPFRASFAPDCQPCLEDADFIDDVRSHGQSIEGGTVFVTTQAGTQVTSTTVAVIGEVRVEKTTVRNTDGSIAKVYPAEAYPGTVWIVRLDGSQAQVSEIRL